MRRAFFGVTIGGAAIVACQLLAGIDDRTVYVGDAQTPDASSGDPCAEVGIPPAPDPSTSKSTDGVEAIFALYAVDTGTSMGKATRPWGFNLDKRCTCPGPPSCAAVNAQLCDYEGGVDDEGQNVFTELQTYAMQLDAGAFFDDSLFNKALQSGASGLLLRLRGYNGQDDDAEVQVALYSSPASMGAPQWDGGDPWSVDQRYVMDGGVDQPLYEVAGWVRNGTLIASPAQIPIVIGSMMGQPVRMQLYSGYIVAKIEKQGAQITGLKGMLAGRWKAAEFLKSLESVPDPLDMSRALCGDGTTDAGLSLTYVAIREAVCRHRDLTANPDNDNKNFKCDAVSFGIGIEMRRARFGNVVMAPQAPQGCGPGWTAVCSN
jgi:hypothetical protein